MNAAGMALWNQSFPKWRETVFIPIIAMWYLKNVSSGVKDAGKAGTFHVPQPRSLCASILKDRWTFRTLPPKHFAKQTWLVSKSLSYACAVTSHTSSGMQLPSLTEFDSERINLSFPRSGVPHWPKCRISLLRIPTLWVPTQNTTGMEKRSRKLKKGVLLWCGEQSACCHFLWHADRCAIALRNHPHGPSGENSIQARDATLESQPHFGFSVVFQRLTLRFLPGNQRLFLYLFCFFLRSFFWVPTNALVKPLTQTDQAKDYCQLICRWISEISNIFWLLVKLVCVYYCLLD